MKREIKAMAHWRGSDTVGGLHLLGEWYGCHGPSLLLQDAAELRRLCRAASEEAGLTIIGDRFHQVSAPLGVMGTVLLAESHLAIHTWPQERFATLDVFVCNHAQITAPRRMRSTGAAVFPRPATRTFFRSSAVRLSSW
jgi:S-adenosylmethionine decarboxylase proenzyme